MQKALVNCPIRRKICDLFGRIRQNPPHFPFLLPSAAGRHGKTHKSPLLFLAQNKKTGRRQSLRPEGGAKTLIFSFLQRHRLLRHLR